MTLKFVHNFCANITLYPLIEFQLFYISIYFLMCKFATSEFNDLKFIYRLSSVKLGMIR
jgi:hypothetical protein